MEFGVLALGEVLDKAILAKVSLASLAFGDALGVLGEVFGKIFGVTGLDFGVPALTCFGVLGIMNRQ